jgi:hypothetical protein
MPSGGGVSPHLTRGSHQLLQQLHLHHVHYHQYQVLSSTTKPNFDQCCFFS